MKFIRDIISEKSKSLGLAETGLTKFDPVESEPDYFSDDLIEPLNEGQISVSAGADEYVFASDINTANSSEAEDDLESGAEEEIAEVVFPETGPVFDEPETDEDHSDFSGTAVSDDAVEDEDEAQEMEAETSVPDGDDLTQYRGFFEETSGDDDDGPELAADFDAPEEDIAEVDEFDALELDAAEVDDFDAPEADIDDVNNFDAPEEDAVKVDDFAPGSGELDDAEEIETADAEAASETVAEATAETNGLRVEPEQETNEFAIREPESERPRSVKPPSPFQRVMKRHEDHSVNVQPEDSAPEQPAPVAETPEAAPEAIVMPSPAVGRSGRQAGRVKTRLLGFGAQESVADPFAETGNATAAGQSMFPVGWLVVVAGPGCGNSFSLAGGVTQIGRGEDQAVRLDFGDSSISRANHAAVAYDQEQRKFFLGHGGKANLVRLNNRPVLSTEELENGNLIRIGETTLKFVGLCGSDFDWDKGQDNELEKASFG